MNTSAGASPVHISNATSDLATQLLQLAAGMKHQENSFTPLLQEIHPQFQRSARNLLHYLYLRSKEIRPLQQQLHNAGLSSFTSSESHTLSQLLQVIQWVAPDADTTHLHTPDLCEVETAQLLRKLHLTTLLGTHAKNDIPHIMVTLSPELANDVDKLEDLLLAGMSVVRINCAHDTPDVWHTMINNVKHASAKTKTSCKIYMDLAGPKIRVSEIPLRKTKDGLLIREGDEIELSEIRHDVLKEKRSHGRLISAARIVVQPAGIISMMKKGDRIFFDDGKFEAHVLTLEEGRARVKIKGISTRKPVLKAGKGVNLPDSALTLSCLTTEDIQYLDFIAAHADIVGYSFVSSPNDLRELRRRLKSHRDDIPSIILKIERVSAVQNLPALLLEGMRDEHFGVMIARGDLAVEIGFERLSEIQQEILWICEAAHVPVVWATQVLENMNKTGFATRSEITDAAMGGMAECVMLNKGKHVVKTVHTLVDILTRFAEHHDKKRFTFRPLSIARNYLNASVRK